MAKVRLPGNGAPSTTPITKAVRWTVRIYMGDNCSWYVAGNVYAITEADAIATARRAIYAAWPQLTKYLDSTPTKATRIYT